MTTAMSVFMVTGTHLLSPQSLSKTRSVRTFINNENKRTVHECTLTFPVNLELQMNKWNYEWTNEQTNEQINERTNERGNERRKIRTNERTNDRSKERTKPERTNREWTNPERKKSKCSVLFMFCLEYEENSRIDSSPLSCPTFYSWY